MAKGVIKPIVGSLSMDYPTQIEWKKKGEFCEGVVTGIQNTPETETAKASQVLIMQHKKLGMVSIWKKAGLSALFEYGQGLVGCVVKIKFTGKEKQTGDKDDMYKFKVDIVSVPE